MINLGDTVQMYEKLTNFMMKLLLGKLAFCWAKLSIPLES